ncbi:MAG: Trm112 family protein [Gammaproteobacteria bacterium]|nr:Trm112 family protein [Gammaproteobacteria bacterium]
MNKKLLDMIVCPITKLPLELLDAERLQQMNAAIAAGKVLNQARQSVDDPVTEALIRRDGHVVYPVMDGIPILLEEESIDWNQMVD